MRRDPVRFALRSVSVCRSDECVSLKTSTRIPVTLTIVVICVELGNGEGTGEAGVGKAKLATA